MKKVSNELNLGQPFNELGVYIPTLAKNRGVLNL